MNTKRHPSLLTLQGTAQRSSFNTKQITRGVLTYLKAYRWRIIASLVCAAVSVCATLYLPILIGEATDLILGPQHVDFHNIALILVRMAIALFIGALAQWTMNILNNYITYRCAQRLRTDGFRHLQKLAVSYVDTHAHGDILSRLVADIDQFTDGLLMFMTQFFTGVITIVLTMVLMFATNWRIALAVVALTPLSALVARFIARKTFTLFRQQSFDRARMTAFINETIGNQKLISTFDQNENSTSLFEQLNQQLQTSSLSSTFYSSTVNPSTRFINALVYAAVALIGAYLAMAGTITIGNLTCMLAYANQYTKPFNEISSVVTELQNSLACAARIFELLSTPAEKDLLLSSSSTIDTHKAAHHLELSHVNFSYDKTSEPLLKDICLNVAQGMHVALVGPTGCGKSTLINLLMRFYDVDAGFICIDGIPLETLHRGDLRSLWGMVLQDTWLENTTIRENIRFGNPCASDEMVEEAARACFAHSFIMRLPQGYDTQLTNNGDILSAGQKQLLCIARIMLADPAMLILDEATSSIDTRTEILIQRAFDRIMEGRTSFIVAHRLSTIESADLILVMNDGQIIERGTHKELLANRGFYYDLYMSQFSD